MLLFNMGINPLLSAFDELLEDGILINSITISVSTYADDNALVSRTKNGLDRMMSTGEKYPNDLCYLADWAFINKIYITINFCFVEIFVYFKYP